MGANPMADAGIGRSIDRRPLGSPRASLRRTLIGLVFATGILAGLAPAGRCRATISATADDGPIYAGRVIEGDSGRPVEGAEIVVERSIRGADPGTLPDWVGEITLRTDADGRFRLAFPPEQAAETRLCIALRIGHPGFIRRRSHRVPLTEVIRGQTTGEEPFFATIPLERGVEYAAQVVVPGGKPAEGIPYAFIVPARRILPAPIIEDDYEGQTDAEGRIRLRMPRAQGLALLVGPPRNARARFPFAPYQHFWGTDIPKKERAAWVPTELGRIVLARGLRLPGRLVDTEGRPIAGQTITAYATLGRARHSTTTEADGSFSLGPLRPANYLIYGEGQSPTSDMDLDAPPRPRSVRIVRPVGVYLKEGATPEPVVLQELPTVRVEVRFVDSKGRPARGNLTHLSGLLPQGRGRPRFFLIDREMERFSAMNAPEPEDARDPLAWGVQEQPDGEGRIVFQAPAGLRNATLFTPAVDEVSAYKHRLTPDGPALPGPAARLGVLEGDRVLTMIAYRAPTILVTVKTEDGVVPADLSVNARYRLGRTNYGNLFSRRPDGRYRSISLMPEHEYQVTVRDPGGAYESAPSQRVRLPEGGSAELSFLLRKQRKPPEVGRPAPPLAVKTIDGRTLDLASLRGKTVLIHFWLLDGRGPDLSSFKAVHDRFGNDERLSMIGLCLSDDADRAAEAIRSNKVSWPQAMLRDGWSDPTVIAYVASRDRAYLIGPDGRLVARDLGGVAIVEAVADALAGKPGGSDKP